MITTATWNTHINPGPIRKGDEITHDVVADAVARFKAAGGTVEREPVSTPPPPVNFIHPTHRHMELELSTI